MSILSSSNILFIEKMSIDLYIGAFECEYHQRQPCEISLAIEVKNLDTLKEDDLDATYNYAKAVELIRSLADRHYQLVEILAQKIAYLLLQEPNILSVEVKIAKIGAFVDVERVGCKIKFNKS